MAEPVTLADVLDALSVFNKPEPNDERWTAEDSIAVVALPAFIDSVIRAWGPRALGVDDLAALVRKLSYSLRKAAPGHALPDKAMDYLKRHNLQGSPLRNAGVQEDQRG